MHGDDVTSDASGEDCYRFVKAAGRFLVVKRTPGISTTDLVGRMLLCTKNHFIRSLRQTLAGEEGAGNLEERKAAGKEMNQRIKDYATDESGLKPGPQILSWIDPGRVGQHESSGETGSFHIMVDGKAAQQGQRIVYVDGGFDLFSSGHIEFLRQVELAEETLARHNGWYDGPTKTQAPAYIVAGIHDDEIINHWKGVNYPIMNIFERGLCVIQCRVCEMYEMYENLDTELTKTKYVDSVVFSAPFTPSKAYLNSLPHGAPAAVYHGPTSFMPLTYDPYTAAKELSIYREIGSHDFQNVNAGEIVQRILKSRDIYEARQRAKGEKAVTEEAVQRRETMEQEALTLEKGRAHDRRHPLTH